MTIDEFVALYPQFAIDFAAPLRNQTRVIEPTVLLALPEELQTTTPYRVGGRGRPNRNQTRTHSQCGTCYRVLRNDQFYTPDSLLSRNQIYSHCRACAAIHNGNRPGGWVARQRIRNRRDAVIDYLAPRCVLCGFDRHPAAMELHSLGGDEAKLFGLLHQFIEIPTVETGERLLIQAKMSLAVCTNCHRLVHADVLAVPSRVDLPSYNLAVLMRRLQE